MRSSKIAFAVAAIMAAGAASASNVNLFVSGASAQRTFWVKDLVGSVCGTNQITTFKNTGTGAPDNAAYRCTAALAVTGVSIGDVVTLYYSAELGSIWGVAPFIPGHGTTTRRFVNPDSADCGATSADTTFQTNGLKASCAITGYSNLTETFSSVNGTAMISATPQIGVTDVEPKFWAQTQNWPTGNTAIGAIPTDADIAALPSYATINGQIFSVIVNNSGPLGTSTGLIGTKSISTQSMKAILTGQYNTWGKVPEVAAAGGSTQPIKLCRRDIGSGTQVSASIFFTGSECFRSGSKLIVTAAAQGKLSTVNGGAGVVENTSTDNVKSCVTGDTGAVGIVSLGTSATYTTLNLDGVQPNAHNAAAGLYPFSFENKLYNGTDASVDAAAAGLAGVLIANAKTASKMKSMNEDGSLTASGQWNIGSVGPRSNFAISALGLMSTWNYTGSNAVSSLFSRGGDSCKTSFNSNL